MRVVNRHYAPQEHQTQPFIRLLQSNNYVYMHIHVHTSLTDREHDYVHEFQTDVDIVCLKIASSNEQYQSVTAIKRLKLISHNLAF